MRAPDRSRSGRFVADTLHGVSTVLQHFRGEPLLQRAAALSFVTVLTLVPLFALVLAIVGTVGHAFLRERVHDYVFSFLEPGVRASSQAYLDGLINRAASRAAGSVSGLALLVSALALIRTVENMLNGMWGVTRPRPLHLRLAVYALILVVGPVLLGFSLAATAALRAKLLGARLALAPALLALAPLAATVVGLGLLYKLGPHAKVKKRAALAGALVAGLLWEAAKHGYAYYTAHFVHYGDLYGSLGVIPLFLVWVYTGWVILLFGARLAYAVQHAGSWGPGALPRREATRSRVAARTMLAVALAAEAGQTPPTIAAVAKESGLPEAAVAESVRLLGEAGLLHEGDDGGLSPGRALTSITLGQVAAAAQAERLDERVTLGTDLASREIDAIFHHAQEAGEEPLVRVDLQRLAARLREGEGAGG